MLGVWGGEAGGRERADVSAPRVPSLNLGSFQSGAHEPNPRGGREQLPLPPLSHPSPPSSPQASQLGVYRAFVDNYGVAMETAEKCCQANSQFAEISEVMRERPDAVQARTPPTPTRVFPLPPWAVGWLLGEQSIPD